jgi:hypothetical protein
MKSSVVRALGLFASVLVAGVAGAQQAVEWKVSEGGNGHWYSAKIYWGLDYAGAVLNESSFPGAHLASIGSAAEWNFLKSTFPGGACWAGGEYRCEAGTCRWVWRDGTPWTFEAWNPGEPDGSSSDERLLVIFGSQPAWFDYLKTHEAGALYEYDEDCNGDGIVDYGQILRGELDDDNANGVPDICEPSVTGVIPPSVPSQGGSTVTIKGANFPVNPSVAIGGVPASDVVRVSATRITATCPALLPGIASIQVNGFMLQDAIYIRPECGSDLDQNGSVDAGDIAIVLLDFGQCYSSPLTAPAPDVPPLLEAQPLPESPRRR